MGTLYQTAVGPPPDPRTRAWLRWYRRLLNFRIEECDRPRSATYHVAASGNDANPGTEAQAWRTLGRAQAALDASTGDLAILFRRGDEFASASGLDVTRPNVTIGAYGAGAKPLLHAFVNAASGGWSDAGGSGRWYRSFATPPGWIRETANRLSPYRHRADIASVTATPRSWTYDSATHTIHLHPGVGVNPNSPALAFEWSGDVNDDGVLVSGDGCLIDGLRLDGWGCVAGAGYQKYGIRSGAQGTNVLVARDCEAFYTGRHGMGVNPSTPGTAGGITTFLRCVTGYFNDSGNLGVNAFVSYNDPGGQETLFDSCEDRYAALPWTNFAGGSGLTSSIYSHTGGANVSLIIANGQQTTVDATKANHSYGGGWSAVDPDVCPGDDADITTYRAIFRGLKVVHNQDGRFDSPIKTAFINCHYKWTIPATHTGQGFYFFNPLFTGGYQINCIWEITDLWTNPGATSPSPRYLTKASASSTNRLVHCAVFYKGDNAAAEGFGTTLKFNDAVGSITLRNCILARMGTRGFWPGVGNNAARLANCATFQVQQTGSSGVDQGAGMIVLGQLAFPFVGQVGGGSDQGVEFDFFDNVRPALPSIGPVEYQPRQILVARTA